MDHYSESVTNFILRSLAMLAFLAVANVHANEIATLRQGIPLDKENIEPAKLGDPLNTDQKRSRAYPMQPPTIPHKIDGYQIDIKANKCMSCHARQRVEESQAPMISVTHYMDRDGNFLAEVSPRRYFCTQCHVTQVGRKPIVDNVFIDMHHLNASSVGGQ